jgi:hypothetical protein
VKGACWIFAPAEAETLVVDQALSELCAVEARVQLVVFLLEHPELGVVILRQTLRARCQDWLRVVRAAAGDPVGCPSCLRQTLPILRLPRNLRLRLPLLLRRRRRRRRLLLCSNGGGGRRVV